MRRQISLSEAPVEENRFVLFVDVAGSTGLAERLGGIGAHRLLDQIFRLLTLSVVDCRGEVHLAKAEKTGRTKAEVDQVISWLTGYGRKELGTQLEKQTDFETFFAQAPRIYPLRAMIKGVVCGVRVEDIKEPTMREIRYLDKLIDELAKGKTMDKILRKTDS